MLHSLVVKLHKFWWLHARCWLGNCCLVWFSLFVAPLIGCTVRFFKIDIDLQVVFQAVKKLFFFQKVKHLAEAIFHVGK